MQRRPTKNTPDPTISHPQVLKPAISASTVLELKESKEKVFGFSYQTDLTHTLTAMAISIMIFQTLTNYFALLGHPYNCLLRLLALLLAAPLPLVSLPPSTPLSPSSPPSSSFFFLMQYISSVNKYRNKRTVLVQVLPGCLWLY